MNMQISEPLVSSGVPGGRNPCNRGDAAGDALRKVLLELERLAGGAGAEHVRRAAADLTLKIDQNRFHLVIAGQFKRGKTSFLNALLGAEILPVSVLPVTSVITLVRWAPQPVAEVVLHSGERVRIPIDAISAYAAEKLNPGNVKGVAQVEVGYPSAYLEGGAALIDTPGIGSVYTHNTQAAYDFLPRIDAAILVTSPDPPLTAAEIEFLAALAAQTPKIYVVLNKIDLLDSFELREVEEFTRNALPAEVKARGPRLFAVSARQALAAARTGDALLWAQSGFESFGRELDRFLKAEKRAVFLRSTLRSTLRQTAALRTHLQLQMRAAEMPGAMLRDRIAALQRQLDWAREQQQDNEVLLAAGVGRLFSEVQEDTRKFAESRVEDLRAAAREKFESGRGLPKTRLAKAMDEFLLTAIGEMFDRWRQEYEAAATAKFREVCSRFESRVNELIGHVQETAGQLFQLSIPRLETPENLVLGEPSGYHADRLLDWGIGKLPMLLPGGLYRRYLASQLMRKVPEYLERNANRVTYDLKRRIEKSMRNFQAALAARLRETVEGIQSSVMEALHRQEQGRLAMEGHLAAARGALAALDRLESDALLAVRSAQVEPEG